MSGIIDKNKARWAVGSFFFFHGICFSSWAVRIPDIQQKLSLTEVSLGSVLFSVPIGSMICSLIAPSLINRFSSKSILLTGIILYSLMLTTIGLAATVPQLVLCLVCFGVVSNLVNISVNTQGIKVENLYGKSVMASLHGLWSLAGFAGGLFGSVMIAFKIMPFIHFSFICLFILSGLSFSSRHLLKDHASEKTAKTAFSLPDKTLLILGAVTFCSMICEGAMFDWSGIYFKKVIFAKPELIGLGYTAFMSTMTLARFLVDRFRDRFSLVTVLTACGLLTGTGFLIAVIYPNLVTGVTGFLLIGAGTAAVVPLVIARAGKLPGRAASTSVTIVSTIGFAGFLTGPPLIGWIAGASSLRISFFLIALLGFAICFLAGKINYSETQPNL